MIRYRMRKETLFKSVQPPFSLMLLTIHEMDWNVTSVNPDSRSNDYIFLFNSLIGQMFCHLVIKTLNSIWMNLKTGYVHHIWFLWKNDEDSVALVVAWVAYFQTKPYCSSSCAQRFGHVKTRWSLPVADLWSMESFELWLCQRASRRGIPPRLEWIWSWLDCTVCRAGLAPATRAKMNKAVHDGQDHPLLHSLTWGGLVALI